MKKWIVAVVAVLLLAAFALIIWSPWKQDHTIDPPKKANDPPVENENTFLAIILEYTVDHVLVEPLEGEQERYSCDRITFSPKDLEQINAAVGTVVEITFDGIMQTSYPATIRADSWRPMSMQVPFNAQWVDKDAVQENTCVITNEVRIISICTNCFFANPLIPTPYTIKFNGRLSDEWCVGDEVIVSYENARYDEENLRAEADYLTIEEIDLDWDEMTFAKPVIYLYPEEETDVSVLLHLQGDFTCTYPAYENGWQVTAAPDGTLTSSSGQAYNYLYWEGLADAEFDFSTGFCVKGADTAAFLETALAQLGLNRREANEFIVYWLPLMEQNPYNIISFQFESYTDAAQLEIYPQPDTVIRVFMAWKAADAYKQMTPQTLTAPQRTGFTVVEWGGSCASAQM